MSGPGFDDRAAGSPRRGPGWGRRVNRAAEQFAGRVDDATGQSARRAASVLAVAVRIARIPSLLVLIAPLPFVLITAALAVSADGIARLVGLAIALVMVGVVAVFGWRRHRIIAAVAEPAALATELGIMANLSGKVEQTRGVLDQLAGGGGARVFSRMRAAWKGVAMTGQWIDGIGDLRRARYFAPPRIGTTVTMTLAALWLTPISAVVALIAVVGTIAGSL